VIKHVLHTKISIKYNRAELVENALRGELNKAQSLKEGCNDNLKQSTGDKAAALLDLLGSLHNQKNWYRPKDRTYISGSPVSLEPQKTDCICL